MSDSIRSNPLVRTALTPLSWLYGGITDIRNLAYNAGILKTVSPGRKTISVGNLTVGGTGKTPMIEYLIRLLSPKYRITIVSRGYGRKTKGLIVADDNSTAEDIGDEPLQFYRKFAPLIKIIVAEKRVDAAQLIDREYPETDLILLDDAYQHRAIDREINLLLTDYHRLFFRDLPFPAGNLRERKKGAERADVVIVTKCPPEMEGAERNRIIESIRNYTKRDTQVFFASVIYGIPAPFKGGKSIDEYSEKIGLAGLAQNGPFEQWLRQQYSLRTFFSFPDHHSYSKTEISTLFFGESEALALLTTEKDMVKLRVIAEELSVSERCFYVPIQTSLEDPKAFEQHLFSKMSQS